MIVFLLGPPGSGKGTQAELIRKNLGFYKVSMGDMLREAVKRDDEIGRKAKKYLEEGKLVPDNLIMRMVRKELGDGRKERNIVFDGFPRNMNQAVSLDKVLESIGRRIDFVIYFETPLSLLTTRLSKRRVCPSCGALYNLESAQPRSGNVCDSCGSYLEQREDDVEEVVSSRFKVYEEETAPIKEFYKEKGLLVSINGTNEKSKVWEDVKRHIEGRLHCDNCD